MANKLLRSGDIKDFQMLGQDGKAAYLVATQIRETFRIKLGKKYADCLAIPQRNDQGNIVDWYIPFESDAPDGEYDIIPWSSASEAEQESARILLKEFEQKVEILGKQLASNPNLEGDQLLFSRLIYDPQTNNSTSSSNLRAIRFPSQEFVYIVNGKPIITFWGFVTAQTRQGGSPFYCLEAIPKTIAPIEAPVVSATPIIASRPWWKRWWLWLLGLLLLLLLLFLLRGCFLKPSIIVDDVKSPEIVTSPDKNQPQELGVDNKSSEITVGNKIPVVINGHQGTVANGQIPTTVTDPNGIAISGTDSATSDGLSTAPLPNTDNSDAQQNQDDQNNVMPNGNTPPTSSDSTDNNSGVDPKATTTADNKLALPSQVMQQGSTKFLNGGWAVGGGIQDKATGKPLRLQYDFDKGNGKVTVTRSDGVKCVGSVGSGIQNTNLNITSSNEAECSDNTKYQLPKIQCVSGANNVADCQGVYKDGAKFPITMKKINK